MKIINGLLVSSICVVLLAPVAFGAGTSLHKVTPENLLNSNPNNKVCYLALGCSAIDPRGCDIR